MKALLAGLSLAALLAATGLGSRPAAACADFAAAPSSRWKTTAENGVAWLLTPCGQRFYSIGVNVIDGGPRNVPGPAYNWMHHYADFPGFLDATGKRLAAWGFNTAASWSFPPEVMRMPTAQNLDLGLRSYFHWGDPFHPRMAEIMTAWARHLTGPYRGSPYRIGYFSDNEMGWWNGPLYTYYIQKPASSHTKQRLVAFLREHYGDDWSRFSADFATAGLASWDDLLKSEGTIVRLRPGGQGIQAIRAWTGIIAGHYYRLVHDALRAADPEALFLGDRLPIYYDPVAVRAMAPYVDVISTNYNIDSPDGWVARYFFEGLQKLADKPVLISEWFFAARQNRSGNRNNGHLMTVESQTQRARGAAAAVKALVREPSVLGVHWFQYYDYPTGGRADGEDYNFGLIDIADKPYDLLVAEFSAINPRLPDVHAKARRPSAPATGRIPRAQIDPEDNSLADWPKSESLVLPLAPSPGEIAFGDLYLSWSDKGLALAVIGMDYYDTDLLALDGDFPRGEAFAVHWGIDVGGRPRHFVLNFIPPRKYGERGAYNMSIEFCRREDGGCLAVDGVQGRYFGANQPRLTAEVLLPWMALGLSGPPRNGTLRMDLAASAFHRSRWMSWSGFSPDQMMRQSKQWRVVRLSR